MTRVRDSHGFTALKVEGGMFPDGYLRTIASLEAPHQQGSDYGLSRSLVVKEELARFWRISNDLYSRYSKQRLRQDLSVKQDRVAVDDWLVPLLSGVFGYNDLTPTSDVELGERVFKLTHRAAGGVVPFLLVSDDFALDKADVRLGHEGRRQAPHMLMQEYLNAEERSLWGFTSNGSKLRLLRDNPSLTRPSYIEIDFELMFEEHLYPDFAALWLATHASRLTPTNGKPSDCIIENWRTQAHETGVRVLESLRVGVTDALQHMGNGFLEHPQNSRLKQDLRSGQLTYDGYFQQLLRLVYRMLFMFTAEERDLLHTRGATAWQREVFAAGYSLSRLRERALRRRYYDRHCDIWYSLQITFRAVNEGTEALGLPALGGLFQNEQCVDLDAAVITNKRLLDAIRSLAFFRSGTTLARVNYRDMDTEELGSVYESLLELQPVVELGCTHMGGSVREAAFSFAGADSDENVKGSARKLTGSYYTPSSLVHELVKSALEPVLKDAIAERPENPRQAILDIKVIDPACGSGHFLLAAARRMAAEIARLEADYGTADEMVRQHALREVVQHSIHGVDRNPLAVELCKTALWMETVEPGKPLTFLNAHIQLGDSLVGILDPEIMSDGIPAGAYKPLTSDDKATCTALKKRNKQTGEFDNLTLFDPDEMLEVARIAADVDALPEDTLGDIKQKNAAWKAALSDPALTRERLRANLFVGAYFAQKTPQTAAWVPLTEDINRLNVEPQHATPAARHPEIYAKTAELARKHYFFHWHLAFADIMQKGGFNVVLGNPPWERIKLQEQEFFATRSREIATAPNKAARSRLIKQLALKDARPAERAMFRDFETAKRESEAISQFVRTARRFPLTGVGDINTYAVFAETILDLINPQGRAGLITPTGIATDNSRRAFFNAVVTGRRLVSLYDFENKEQVFPDVHRSYKFCLLTLSGVDQPCQEAEFAFFLHNTEQLGARERHISLSSEDFALFNPNTRTCPIFRTQQDIEIARKMYLRAGVLWQEKRDGQPEMNPWNISFQLMFQMSSDSRLFRTREKLNEEGWELEGNVFMRNGEQYLPLYEAKLFHQYDHRFATFEGVPAAKARKGQARNVTSAEKASPEKVILPRYWIPEEEVMKKLDGSTGGKVDMGSRTNARQTQLIDHQLDAIHKQSSKVIAPPPLEEPFDRDPTLDRLAALARSSLSERSPAQPTNVQESSP